MAEKVKILVKYSYFADVFPPNLAIKLPENTSINKHAIELKDGKQPLYRPIYSLGLIELEILKIYIKTYSKTQFVWPSKSSADASILFDKKPDSNFCLCIDYKGLNNLTIRNWYLLPLIGESLD